MANGEKQTAATRINQSAVLHGFSNNSEDLRSMGGANNLNRLSCFPLIEGTTATTSSTTTHPKFASYHFLIMSVLLYGYFLHHSAAKQELRVCVRILIRFKSMSRELFESLRIHVFLFVSVVIVTHAARQQSFSSFLLLTSSLRLNVYLKTETFERLHQGAKVRP